MHFTTFVRDYEWIHIGIGILGNGLFVLGSLLFLADVRSAAIAVYIGASIGMLIGSVGSAIVSYKRWQWKWFRR